MKVVIISDTHGEHEQMVIPDGDILLHAGDMSKRGTMAEIEAFNLWLGTLPHAHKVFIAGNHDFCLERQPEIAQAVLTNCHYLLDEMIDIEGVKIYGSPWTPNFYDWAFQLQRGAELRQKWELIPAGLDFLITHGPPQGILDLTIHGDNAGCQDLTEIVVERKPRYHLFGHIHEAAGQQIVAETTYFNASSVNLQYDPINLPIVVEI